MSSTRQVEPAPASFLRQSAELNALFALEGVANFLLDVAVAAVFGLSTHSDGFFAAWLLPRALGHGVLQSLTNSFMGLFADDEDRTAAYNQAISIILLAALPLAAVLSAASPWWLLLTIPGAASETQLIAIAPARLFSWIVMFGALFETLRAIYYREGQRAFPSLSRLIGSVVSIGLLLTVVRDGNLMLAAGSVVAGAALQTAISFAGLGWRLRFRFRPSWPDSEKLREMGPMLGSPLAGQGIRLIAGLIEQALASLLPAGGITAVNYANRIIQTIERFVFRGFLITTIQVDSSKDRVDLSGHFRLVILIALPISIVLGALSQPLVAVIFRRGRFSATDGQILALTLQTYAPAILGIALTRIPFGLAFARKQSGVIIGYFGLVSSALLLSEVLLINLGFDLRAFGLGYSVAIWLAFAWLYWSVLRPESKQLFSWSDTFRLLFVGLSSWVGTSLLVSVVQRSSTGGPAADWLTLAVGLSSCVLFLTAVSYLLKVDEVKLLLGWLRGMLK